jgi:hypothetical protein
MALRLPHFLALSPKRTLVVHRKGSRPGDGGPAQPGRVRGLWHKYDSLIVAPILTADAAEARVSEGFEKKD